MTNANVYGRLWTIWTVIALGTLAVGFASNIDSLHPQIPSVAHFIPSSTHPFTASGSIQIVVDSGFATHRDSDDIYLPSLLQYANTFREDLISLIGFSNVPHVLLGVLPFPQVTTPVIFLSLGAINKTYYNGKPSLDGYDLDISSTTVIIKGAGTIGAWWGTRTLLQQIAIERHDKTSSFISIPAGHAFDVPGWEVRGFMLDAGRHWFEASFICKDLEAVNFLT